MQTTRIYHSIAPAVLLVALLALLILLGRADHGQPGSPQTGVSATPTPANIVGSDGRPVSAPTAAAISYLCVDGYTFVKLGDDGIALFPEEDAVCAVKPPVPPTRPDSSV